MKDVGHRDSRRDKNQQQRMHWRVVQWRTQRYQMFGMSRQPMVKLVHSSEYLIQGKKSHGQQTKNFDERFERHHRNQSPVMLAIRAENRGEEGNGHAINQGKTLPQTKFRQSGA